MKNFTINNNSGIKGFINRNKPYVLAGILVLATLLLLALTGCQDESDSSVPHSVANAEQVEAATQRLDHMCYFAERDAEDLNDFIMGNSCDGEDMKKLTDALDCHEECESFCPLDATVACLHCSVDIFNYANKLDCK